MICLESESFIKTINKYINFNATLYSHKKLFFKTNHFDIKSALRTINNTNSWKQFIIIENPLEKFLNDFLQYCSNYREDNYTNSSLCYSCNGNINCFINNLFDDFYQKSKSYKQIHPSLKDNIFAPQTWRCNSHMDLHKHEKIRYEDIKNSNFTSIEMLLNNFNTTEVFKLSFVNELLENYRKKYSSINYLNKRLIMNKIRKSSLLTQRLVTIYFYDFMALEYDFPTFE
uniref:Uncharacterized protein n=1 Tax=Parastrongyloides trichosuri TaxID=131310 RepID=A0A0N4ZWH1_PARTI